LTLCDNFAMFLSVVILAAGQGKRMVSRLPKVLHRVGGMTLIERVIDIARRLKPATICVVYGHGGEQVPRAVDAPGVVFVKQMPQLGTGDALRRALPKIRRSDLTLVLYGDVPLVRPATLAPMLAGKLERVVVLTAVVDDPAGYGRVLRDRAGRVRRIIEDVDATPAQKRIREINTGIMALPTKRLASWLGRIEARNAQGEYYLTDLVSQARADGVPVEAVPAQNAAEISGANSRAQLAQLERILQWRCAQELLERGVSLADPARIDVRGELNCGCDAAIDVNCVFEGEVTLGDEVSIGPNCVLRNVTIGARTVIAPYTLIEDAIIGADCRVGPHARIRPGTRLADHVHVGNFVEVKNSRIGEHSKANHLAYLGDATLGARVNVGAGTITCNYDGANKHRTIIEDDVQIGSDVQLVAPVTVGRGATIGAGTTVWKAAPAGVLTINEKTQVIRQRWKRPAKRQR
jgi:bifunctional UDP-N-acetylglucosamine pyrophosphorylase/glucosamine-1-phosphate N-acetyltransferase